MKSPRVIVTEALCYVTIAAGAPIAELLISDRPLTNRALWAAGVMAIIAGATALKAFLSQSMQNPPPAVPPGAFDRMDAILADPPAPADIPSKPTGRLSPAALTVAALAGLSLLFLTGCEGFKLPPIKGKACYITKDGEVCVASDGSAIEVEVSNSALRLPTSDFPQ
jgi:hypothetical protein